MRKDENIKLPAGSRIICPNGHDCGAVSAQIKDDETIHSGLITFRNTIPTADPAHICRTCGETVAKFAEGSWLVSTDLGWVK